MRDRSRIIFGMIYSKGDILVPKGKQYPDCAVVVGGYDAGGRLLTHALGGGFEQRLSRASANLFRLVKEGERAAVLFRRGRFALADSDEVFSGWTDGRHWNGWEMPYFELAEAERLRLWLGGQEAYFDPERDAFVTMWQDGEEELWASVVVPVSDGSAVKVYPVGARCVDLG
jgi:hypothetical protein